MSDVLSSKRLETSSVDGQVAFIDWTAPKGRAVYVVSVSQYSLGLFADVGVGSDDGVSSGASAEELSSSAADLARC